MAQVGSLLDLLIAITTPRQPQVREEVQFMASFISGRSSRNGHTEQGSGAQQQEQAQQQARPETPPGPRCRLCFESEADTKLVHPGCACKGSLEFIHVGCLQNWQRTLAEQGEYKRALVCEICKKPYSRPYRKFEADRKYLPPTWQDRLVALVKAMAYSPGFLFKLWRLSVLASGLAVGARQGAVGAGAGLALGLELAKPVAQLVLQVAPEAGLLAAWIPWLKAPVKWAVYGVLSALTVEVLLASAAGMLCGGAVGFARGSASVLSVSAELCGKIAEGALAVVGASDGRRSVAAARTVAAVRALHAVQAARARALMAGVMSAPGAAVGVAGRRNNSTVAGSVWQALGHTAGGACLWAWQHAVRSALGF